MIISHTVLTILNPSEHHFGLWSNKTSITQLAKHLTTMLLGVTILGLLL